MRPRCAALLFVLTLAGAVLAGCTSSGADGPEVGSTAPSEARAWLQRGYDARGTFSPPGTGPEWSDVALEVPLGGQPQRHIVILDRHAYVPVELGGQDRGLYEDFGNGPSALMRIDLDSGAVQTLAEWDSPVDSVASDGERLFVVVDGIGVVAVAPSGDELWRYRWPLRYPAAEARPNWSGCWGGMNVADDAVTVACEVATYRDENPDGVSAPRWQGEAYGLVARLDARTGEERWNWTADGTTESEYTLQRDLPVASAGFPTSFRELPVGLSVSGEFVVFLTWGYGVPPLRSILVALDNETGELLWSDLSEPILPEEILVEEYDVENPTTLRTRTELLFSRPAITGNMVLVKHDGALRAFNLGTGDRLWELDVGSQDTRPEIVPYADLAMEGDDLYVASAQNLYRYSIANEQASGWRQSLNAAAGESFEEGPLVLDGGVFLGSWSPGDQRSGLYAFDADVGTMLWRTEWPGSDLGDLAATDGLVVFTDRTRGALVAVGASAASPVVTAEISDAYPPIGAPVEIDLSASTAGAGGPPNRFRVDWGDGTVTDWQTDPVFSHVYQGEGDATARFFVSNDGNQSASVAHTFHTGATPPVEPNLVETAFARDNQDLTFGLLGLAVALAGGLSALWHRRTKRGRLERELAAIDRAHDSTRDRPIDCEAALLERKAHCRGLLLDGKIEEPQFAVLENRIDELSRNLRLAALDDRFDFLPYGLVKALRDMLSDGRISAWEHAHVVRALDEDGVLTKRQKQKVRAQVDSWFRRDAGVDR